MLKLFAKASNSLWLNIVLAYQEMLEHFDYIGDKFSDTYEDFNRKRVIWEESKFPEYQNFPNVPKFPKIVRNIPKQS